LFILQSLQIECPSSVDVGKMKAEFLQQYYDKKGVPLRSKLIGSFSSQMALAATLPWAYNLLFKTPAFRKTVNRVVGFHPERTMPLLHKTTLRKWWLKHRQKMTDDRGQMTEEEEIPSSVIHHPHPKKSISSAMNLPITTMWKVGQKAILLLEALGYEVVLPEHEESGRTWLSKGLVRKAKELANRNVTLLKDVVTAETPIIGIEPSAILALRDEYPELVSPELVPAARTIAQNTFLFEEWFATEIERGSIKSTQFAENNKPFIFTAIAIRKRFRLQSLSRKPCHCTGISNRRNSFRMLRHGRFVWL
jgi:Fe-S oxidoreductase